MKRRVEVTYDRLKSYVSNLAQWLKEEKAEIDNMSPVLKAPFVGVIDDRTLDRYFEQQKDEVTSGVRLANLFDDYSMRNMEIVRFRDETLQTLLKEQLESTVSDFSMYRYVSGNKEYAYLQPPRTLDLTLGDLENNGMPFAENHSARTDNIVSKNIYIRTDTNQELNAWSGMFAKYFVTRPDMRPLTTPDELIISQVEVLHFDEVD